MQKLTFTLPRQFLVTRKLLKCRVDNRQKSFEFLRMSLNTTTSYFVTVPLIVNVL